MSKPGPKEKLDELKKGQIVALLSAGMSRTAAARYVGVCYNTVVNTAKRDSAFLLDLKKAESRAQFTPVHNIMEASKKDWRAGAWLLERLAPDDFLKVMPGHLTLQGLPEFVRKWVVNMYQSVQDPQDRRRMRSRMKALLRITIREAHGCHPNHPGGHWPIHRRSRRRRRGGADGAITPPC